MSRERRLVAALGGMLLLSLVCLSGRLCWLHLATNVEAFSRVERQTTRTRTLPAQRGAILDRFGRLLACSVDTVRAWVLPRNLRDISRDPLDHTLRVGDAAAFLAPLVRRDPTELRERLSGDAYRVLGGAVSDPWHIERMRAESGGLLRGVDLVPGTARRYPTGRIAGNLLGFVDHEGRGVSGLEQSLEQWLSGWDGERRLRVDPHGREVHDPTLPTVDPVHGLDATLSIDLWVQQLVERELARALEEQEAERAVGVVMETLTGEVLALASLPCIDADDGADRLPDAAIIGAVQEMYPPGSTFKALMMAAALELGLAHIGEPPIPCESPTRFGRRRIKDSHPQDHPLTLEEIIVHSSNIGMATLLTRHVPEDRPRDTALMEPIHDVLLRLGFGRPTGVPLPAEACGRITPLDDWTRNYTLASVAFGQELGVSALQMAAAASSLYDGLYRPPQLLLRWSDGDGGSHPLQPPPAVPVFSPEVVEPVRAWMARSVAEGPCDELRGVGWPVAGKTGTAECEVSLGSEVHSFVGLVPAHDPLVTVVVVLRAPRHARFASQSASPPAGRILRLLMPYLGRPHEGNKG